MASKKPGDEVIFNFSMRSLSSQAAVPIKTDSLKDGTSTVPVKKKATVAVNDATRSAVSLSTQLFRSITDAVQSSANEEVLEHCYDDKNHLGRTTKIRVTAGSNWVNNKGSEVKYGAKALQQFQQCSETQKEGRNFNPGGKKKQVVPTSKGLQDSREFDDNQVIFTPPLHCPNFSCVTK